MTSQHQQEERHLRNPPLFLDALYCEEDWERFSEDSFQKDDDENRCSDCVNPGHPLLLEHDLFWEDEELFSLSSKEEKNQLYHTLESTPYLADARREAVGWVLKVTAFYSFSAHAAVLAVNYFDRFLFSFQSHIEKPWMTQLAAVACLSLAAKVEEIQVPLLVDLQVEESKYVFEAKTIQRMEILVLSALQWRMNPVTPLSFLDYITRRLGLKHYICCKFLKKCEFLLLSVISHCRFMCYLPSVMATATMLHVFNSLDPSVGIEYKNQLLNMLGNDKGNVEECCKLIKEVDSVGHFSQSIKRKVEPLPGSPKAVADIAFTSDSSTDSGAVAAVASASVSSSPVPLSKKSKVENHHSGGTTDILCIPR